MGGSVGAAQAPGSAAARHGARWATLRAKGVYRGVVGCGHLREPGYGGKGLRRLYGVHAGTWQTGSQPVQHNGTGAGAAWPHASTSMLASASSARLASASWPPCCCCC